ncbi:hypothetical protein QR680_018502 [Steinernema hermaphroditum]|uniref:Serine/threonine-protein phosphatase n=1 Tax=Steinernema hermaphroditum TaxID=289476 RepID=A0AA39HJ02_9BILA|nr:hypothetical protein QR680_018502 [Steinernema hermaphroditum]
MAFKLDSLIDRFLSVTLENVSLRCTVLEEEIVLLCNIARDVFLSQPPLLEVEAPIKVCGDIHGQYKDLLRIFNRCGFPPDASYLFLGDYVDRGKNNLETICLLFCYKVKYPENFFVLRGNHETAGINRVYGFYDECQRRYSVRLWQDVFNCLPICALIGGRIFCMHGGLSPAMDNWDQLRRIVRPLDPANPSIETDLLWADPERLIKGWHPNTRGISYVFGADVVKEFCQTMDIDLVARAHQVVQDGYEFFAKRRLVTLFSAPHYCGEFDNAAGVMVVHGELLCTFEVLRSTHKSLKMKREL